MTKTGYMTIDDSPSEEMLRKVEYLDSKGIPAVWFSRGDYLEERKEPALKAIESGHVIANHSYSHPNFSELSVEECKEEIIRTDEIIDEIYDESGVERSAKYFRFPYIDRGFTEGENTLVPEDDENERKVRGIQEFLGELGYMKPDLGIDYYYYDELGCEEWIDFYYTYMPRIYDMDDDWILEDILEEMDSDDPESLEGLEYDHSDEILLLHDHDDTFEVFRAIVDKIAEKDIEFELPS